MTSQALGRELPEPSNTKHALETESITRLYAKVAIPIAFGMVLNGLYNIIDAYFIAKFVGAEAFAAVTAVFPFQMFFIALGAFIGNGVSILVSQYRGAKKRAEANTVIHNAFTLIVIIAIILAILIVCCASQLLGAIGLTDLLLADAKAYIFPITLGAILILSLSLISDLLRALTNMRGLFLIMLSGAIGNVLLDYLLIVAGGMGVRGAAFATLLAQLAGVVLGVNLLRADKFFLDISRLRFTLSMNVLRRFLSLGLPVFISYLGASIIMLVISTSIAHRALVDTEQLIAAYGIISRIHIFLILPLFAISYASQTIIAHNFGASNGIRVKKAAITGVVIATCYLSVMTLCLYLLPRQIIGLFSQEESLITQTQSIAKIMFLLLPLSGISALCVAYFQATGKARLAMILSTAQVYVFLLPMLLFIVAKFELNDIWYAYPITQCLSIMLAATLLWTQKRKRGLHNLSYQEQVS